VTISRRQFLAGSLAAGAGLVVSRSLRAGAAATDPNRFALLADTHVWEHRDGIHRGVKPAEHLSQAIREIAALDPHPAGAILCGDCVYLEGHAADYATLAELVRPLSTAGIPLHLLPGNHDNRENLWAAFPEAKPKKPLLPGRHVAIVETPHANWFLLDSLEKTNSTPGLLGKEQLAWLAKALDARAEKLALVMAHHDLGKAESLRDAADLMDVLVPRKQVKAYFFGHTHAWRVSARQNIHLVNLPACAWVFDSSQPYGWVDIRLEAGGAKLVLNTLDKTHPKSGDRAELKWRA
jgi:3',5'-cyclic-AMP phosphodiesterase